MKILFSIPYYAPAYSYGGPVAASEMSAEGLVEKGVEIDVITTDVLDAKKRNPVLEENLNGVKVFRFKNFSNTLAKQANLYAPSGLKNWLKKNIANYDLIHFHDVFAFLLTMPVMDAVIEHNIAFIVQPHGTTNNEHIENSGILKPVKKYLLKRYNKRFTYASAFIALSETEKNAVSRYYPKEKIEIIPNGIVMPDLSSIDTSGIRESLKLGRDTKLIAFLGRLHSIKGIDISLKILSKIKNTDFHFIIVGPDEQNEKKHLINLSERLGLSNKITFTGPAYGNEKYKYLKAADIFMLMSRAEGHPVTCIEALACGTPVFVSNPAGLTDFKKFNAGIIVDSQNIEKSAEILSTVLNDSNKLNSLKKNTQKIVRDLFTKKRMVDSIYELYRSII